MRYKVGDKYDREYIINDENGLEMDRFQLRGEVIYADDDEFLVKASNSSSAEITQFYSLPLDLCIETYPSIDFKSVKTQHFENFIPLEQGTEAFLFIDDDEINE